MSSASLALFVPFDFQPRLGFVATSGTMAMSRGFEFLSKPITFILALIEDNKRKYSSDTQFGASVCFVPDGYHTIGTLSY